MQIRLPIPPVMFQAPQSLPVHYLSSEWWFATGPHNHSYMSKLRFGSLCLQQNGYAYAL